MMHGQKNIKSSGVINTSCRVQAHEETVLQSPQSILRGWPNQENEIGGACGMHTAVCCGNVKKIFRLEEIGVVRRIILKCILKE